MIFFKSCVYSTGSALSLALVFGSTLAGPIMKRYGRKLQTIVSLGIHSIAWGIIAVSQDFITLCAGMVINGLALGGCDAFTCLYMGECSHPKYRGQFMSSMFVLVIGSTVVLYALALVLNWRGLAIFISIAPLIRLPVLCKIPESPIWLLGQRRIEEARQAMQWLYGDHYDIEHELQECVKHQQETKEAMATWKDALTWQYLKPVAIVAVLTLLRQFSGGTALLMYLSQVLKRVDLGFDTKYASLVIACGQLVFILVSGKLFDVVGRKKTVLMSGMHMCMSEAAMGAYFYIDKHPEYSNILKGQVNIFQLILMNISTFDIFFAGMNGFLCCSLA